MTIGECLFHSSPATGRLKGQVCSLVYDLAATWSWPTFIQRTQVNSRLWLHAIDGSTINVVSCIIIINNIVKIIATLSWISAYKITYIVTIVSSGALNSTDSLTVMNDITGSLFRVSK